MKGRHAVIDVGSNTIHLLVGEADDGVVLPVTGEKFSARPGAGVDRTGRIEGERIPVAAEAVRLFGRAAALHGARELAVLATRPSETRKTAGRSSRRCAIGRGWGCV